MAAGPGSDCGSLQGVVWVSLSELVKIINDNATYCRLAQFIGNRKELNEEKLEKLEELTMDAAKAKAILDASRSSMGQYRA